MSGITIAFAAAATAIGMFAGVKPLPDGVTVAEVGDWKLRVNVGRDAVVHDGTTIGPYEIHGTHAKYLAVIVLAPGGGAVGGYSEDQFIEDMKAFIGADHEIFA